MLDLGGFAHPVEPKVAALAVLEQLWARRLCSPQPRTKVERALVDVFGFAPESAIRTSADFAQGQALLAGGFISEPTFVQMGERITEEGGEDVKVPLLGVELVAR